MIRQLTFCFLFFLSCSSEKNKQLDFLSDDLFILRDLENSSIIHSFKYHNERLYTDSTLRTEFIPLDSTFKRLILAPILKKDLGVDMDYSQKYVLSHFIAKQKSIGKYQPIVIYSTGDDYSSLILALLDSTFQPVAHLVLSGGLFAGPYEVNDSLTSLGEEILSKINGSEIKSFTSKTYVWTNNRDDSAFIDSVIHSIKIRVDGTIETKLIDSLRIRRNI